MLSKWYLGKHNSVSSIFNLQLFLNKIPRNCHLNFSLHILKYFKVQSGSAGKILLHSQTY